MRRRRAVGHALALALAGLLTSPAALRAQPTGVRRRPLVFPRDHGAHPEARLEWWYVTGSLALSAERAEPVEAAPPPAYGFQLTFFRLRTGIGEHPSRFAARQLVFAHAALSDLAARRLHHDQRLARAGFGLAAAAQDDTAVRLHDWHLERREGGPAGVYDARVATPAFALDLRLATTQPRLLQGDAGFSRKGPREAQASHYYSQPQLAVEGVLDREGERRRVAGRAWLDHEWSDSLLDAEAVGWDWIGINLDDGGALTAFRLRRADGRATWGGGSFRPGGDAAVRAFAPDEVVFTAQRHWTSPATAGRYPVEWTVQTPAGRHTLRALFDAQELDARASTGTVYWEGLAELFDDTGRRVGRGYLEMTGYAGRLRL